LAVSNPRIHACSFPQLTKIVVSFISLFDKSRPYLRLSSLSSDKVPILFAVLLQIRWDRVFRTPHLASAFPGWETPLTVSTISCADRSILVQLFRKERFSYTLALLKRTVGHLECPPLGRTFKDPIAEQANAISYAVRCTLVRQSLLQISLLNCFSLGSGAS
jgi:hypothetical protein